MSILSKGIEISFVDNANAPTPAKPLILAHLYFLKIFLFLVLWYAFAKTAIDAIEVKGSPYTKLDDRVPLAISTNSSFSFFSNYKSKQEHLLMMIIIPKTQDV